MSGAINNVIAGLLLGFLGSLHCLTMCSGIQTGLQIKASRHDTSQSFPLSGLLFIHVGRIISYACAGGLAASFAYVGFASMDKMTLHTTLQLLSGLVLMLIGAQLLGWLGSATALGAWCWQALQPVLRHCLPANTPLKQFIAGVCWGWLPCGLVYNGLLIAGSSGQPLWGALTMVAFGLGTLPMLLGVGLLHRQLTYLAQPTFKRLVGIALIILGIGLFLGLFNLHLGHAQHLH